jgi:ribosomal protein S18 acetylase RimI-like enzyme
MITIRELSDRNLAAASRIFDVRSRRGGAEVHSERLRSLLSGPRAFGLGAFSGPALVGYIVGEVRAFEFGSDPAGWIVEIGVAPDREDDGIGSSLREAAVARFRSMGVTSIRTMVRRDDVRVMRFFRSAGFHLGPYLELEMEVRP